MSAGLPGSFPHFQAPSFQSLIHSLTEASPNPSTGPRYPNHMLAQESVPTRGSHFTNCLEAVPSKMSTLRTRGYVFFIPLFALVPSPEAETQ
jgi:hypothetical protein